MTLLKSLLKEGKTSLFQVYELDMDGRYPFLYMGVFKASDAKEARELAAKHYKNKEIATTGFYGAEEVTAAELNKIKKKLEKDIKDQTQILN